MVGDEGFEPPTFCSQSRRSSQAELISVLHSGAEGGNRTHDPFLTKEEHYHYATTALEPAKRLELLVFVFFLTKEVLSPLNHAGFQSNRFPNNSEGRALYGASTPIRTEKT